MNTPVWLQNFRSQQVRVLDSRRHGLIEASAGTGKTFAIEHLVLRLLVENPTWNPEEILLLSFTDKTVAELRERIRNLLHAQHDEVGSTKRIDGWSPRDAARIRQMWLHADDLSIQSLHAFCQSALRRDPVANDALLRTELVTDNAVAEIALDRLLRDTWPQDPHRLEGLVEALGIKEGRHWRLRLIKLALQWQPWRADTLDPDRVHPEVLDTLLAEVDDAVQAFPKALTAIENGDFPVASFRQSFDYTPTGKPRKNPEKELGKNAFQKLFLRMEEHTPSSGDLPWSRDHVLKWFRSTYSAAASVVTKGWDTALPRDAASRSEWQRLAHLCAVIRNACDPVMEARKLRVLGLLAEAAQELRHALDDEKTRRGLISYDDMPRHLVEALRRKPALAARLGARYKVCIVDEFQDTDPLQWEILEALCLRQEPRPEAKPQDALPPPSLPLFLVGDPKQAIYSFRGGDLRTYLTARARFHDLATKGRAQGLGLDANHRSSKALIETLNAVFAHPEWFGPAPETSADPAWQLPATSGQIVFTPVTAGRADAGGDADAAAGPVLFLRDFTPAAAPEASGNGSENRDGKIPKPRKADVEREVRNWIVARIAAAIRDDNALPQDFAVLARTKAEGEAIARLLRRRGVPCRIQDRRGPFHGPAADALRLLLEWIDDATSPDAQARILMLPFARHDDTDAPRGRPEQCPPLIARWAALARAGHWPEFFLSVLHEGGYRARLAATSEADATRFERLVGLLSEVGATPGVTARALCDRFDAMRRGEDIAEDGDSGDTPAPVSAESTAARETTGNPDAANATAVAPAATTAPTANGAHVAMAGAVTVMTLHVSKGLEFRHVLIAASGAGSASDFFVLRDAGTSGFRIALDTGNEDFKRQAALQAHEENKRLFYVALTRARETLSIPLLPPQFSKAESGPLGGFVAEALRHVAAQPQFAKHVRYDEEGVTTVSLERAETGGDVKTSGEARARRLAETHAAFTRRRLLTSYSRLARRAAAADRGGTGLTKQDLIPGATETVLTEDGARAQRQESVPETTGADDGNASAPHTAASGTHATPGAVIITAAELPPGAAAGTALHALLERTPFASVREAESPEAWLAQPGRRARVEEVLKRESVDTGCAPAAARAVWNALRAPLPEGPQPGHPNNPALSSPFRLADIPPGDLHHEVEFLLSFGNASGQAHSANLRPDGTLPEDIGVKATPRGLFLWGFIDLVYRRAGRYYLLDWKSNLLPSYDEDAVRRSMDEHRYHLQWKLYAVALDHWLTARLPGYDPAVHFGGVHYLYLRGTTPTRFAGYSAHPTPQQLRAIWPQEIAALLAPSADEGITASSSRKSNAGDRHETR